jgi:glycosyltransferase involved in cell wall biosynthesis
MRIAVVGTRGFPNVQGGVEAHCQHLYPRLVQLGCEIIVFTRRQYVDAQLMGYKGVKLAPIRTIRIKSLENVVHTFFAILKAYRHKPDIIHFQAIGAASLIPLAKLFGMKVLLTTHGSNYKHRKWGYFGKAILKISEYLGVTYSDAIISISKTIAGEIKQKYRKDSYIIPNGAEITDSVRTDHALREYSLTQKRYILAVGRLVPDKGFHDLINAFNKAQLDGWKLVIVGKADHADKYSRELVMMARNNSNIIFTGFLTGQPLGEIFSYAGLFVLPSYYEGMPLVLLEALSYGLPCLVSDIPANREIELPIENYFAAGDIDLLSRKISEFINKRITEKGKNILRDELTAKYNWDIIAQDTIAVYNNILS